MGATSSSSADRPHATRGRGQGRGQGRGTRSAASQQESPNGIAMSSPAVKRAVPVGRNRAIPTSTPAPNTLAQVNTKTKNTRSLPPTPVQGGPTSLCAPATSEQAADVVSAEIILSSNADGSKVPDVHLDPPAAEPLQSEQKSAKDKESKGEEKNETHTQDDTDYDSHMPESSSRGKFCLPPLSFSAKVSPADINPLCRLKVEEGPLCMDYHPGFNILLIGSAKEINFIKVNPTAAHGIGFIPEHSVGDDGDRVDKEAVSITVESTASSPVRATDETGGVGSPAAGRPLITPVSGYTVGPTIKSSPSTSSGKKKNIINEGQGIASPSQPPHSSNATKPLVLLEKYKGPQKVEDIMWHPNQQEATFAFVEVGKITILMDVLQFRSNTKNMANASASKGQGASVAASSQVPTRSSAVETTTSGVTFQRVLPLARNRKKLATDQAVSGRLDPPSRHMSSPGGNVHGNSVHLFTQSLLRQVEPAPKELLELTIPISYAKTSRVVWDPHHPYTLAVTSVATYFELWEIPIMNVSQEEALREYRRRGDKHGIEEKQSVTEKQRWMRVGKPRLLIRPPATSSRRATPQDVCFSPFNPEWIVVVSEDSGHTSDVRIFDRRYLDNPSTVFVLPIAGLGLSASFHPLYRDILAVSYRKGRTKSSSTVEFWEFVVDQPSKGTGADIKEGGDAEVSSSSSSGFSQSMKESSIAPQSASQTSSPRRRQHNVVEDGTDPNWSVSTARPPGVGGMKGLKSPRDTASEPEQSPFTTVLNQEKSMEGPTEKILEVRRDVLPPISSYVCFARFRWRPPSFTSSTSIQLKRSRHHVHVRTTSDVVGTPEPSSHGKVQDPFPQVKMDQTLTHSSALSLSESYLSQMWFATSFTDFDSTVCIWDAAYRYSPIIQYNFIPPDNPLPLTQPTHGGVGSHLASGSSLSVGEAPLVMGSLSSSTLGLPANPTASSAASAVGRNKKKEIDAVPADVVWTDSLGLVAVFRSGEVVFASLISDESFHVDEQEEEGVDHVKGPLFTMNDNGEGGVTWKSQKHYHAGFSPMRNTAPLIHPAPPLLVPHTISFSPLAHFPTATIQANPYGGFVLQQEHGGISNSLSHGAVGNNSMPLFVQLKDYYSRVLKHDIGKWILEHVPSWFLISITQDDPSFTSMQRSQSGTSFEEEQRHSWSPFSAIISHARNNTHSNNTSPTTLMISSPLAPGDHLDHGKKVDHPSSILTTSSSSPAYPRKSVNRHPTFTALEKEERSKKSPPSSLGGSTTVGGGVSSPPLPHWIPEEQLDYTGISLSAGGRNQEKRKRYYFGSFFRQLQAKEEELMSHSIGIQRSDPYFAPPSSFEASSSPQLSMLLTQLGVTHPHIQFCNSIYAPTPLITDANDIFGPVYRVYHPSLSTLSRSCSWGGSYKEHPQERDRFLSFAMLWDMGYDAALQLQQLNAHLKKWGQRDGERREGSGERFGGLGAAGEVDNEGNHAILDGVHITAGSALRAQRTGRNATPLPNETSSAHRASQIPHSQGIALNLLSSISEGSLLKNSVQEEQQKRFASLKRESTQSFQGENESEEASIRQQRTLSSAAKEDLELEDEEDMQQVEDLLELVGHAIDIYFADRMQHNADICEQQAVNDSNRFAAALTQSCTSFVPVRNGSVNSPAGASTAAAAAAAARSAMMATLSEEDILMLQENHRREQQQDGRAHWWAAAAHVWRSNLPSLILTFTVSQLEQASLLGDCQFCITLYQLYGLWWKLRRAVTEAATREWGSRTLSRRRAVRHEKNPDVDIFHFDGSTSCPLIPTPIDPEAAKWRALESASNSKRQAQTMPLHSYLGPNTSSVSALPTVGRTVQWPECSPEAWRQRGLQWLDDYVAQLHTADLFVPINELYLITQEIFGVDNPILYSSHLAYEKQLTYVFCEECKVRSGEGLHAASHHHAASASASSSSKHSKGKGEAPPLIVNTKAIRQHREQSGADGGIDPAVNLEATIAMVVNEGRPVDDAGSQSKNEGRSKGQSLRGSTFIGPSVMSGGTPSCHHCHKRTALQQEKEEGRMLKGREEREIKRLQAKKELKMKTQCHKAKPKIHGCKQPDDSPHKSEEKTKHQRKHHGRKRRSSDCPISTSSSSSRRSSLTLNSSENDERGSCSASSSFSSTYSSTYSESTTSLSTSSYSSSDDESDVSTTLSTSSSSYSLPSAGPLSGATTSRDSDRLRRARNYRVALGSIFHFWVSPRLPAIVTPSTFADALVAQVAMGPDWDRKWGPNRLAKRLSSTACRPIKARPNIRMLHAERVKQRSNIVESSTSLLSEIHPHRISLEHHHRPLLNAVCSSCFNLNGMTCVICDALVEGIFVRFPRCVHGGHSEHVQEWIQRADACPICGAAIHASATAETAEEEVSRLLYE